MTAPDLIDPTGPLPSTHDRSAAGTQTGKRASDLLTVQGGLLDHAAGGPQAAAPDLPDVCECCGASRGIRRGRKVGRIRLGILPKSQNEREGLLFAAAQKKRPGMAHVVREEARTIYAAIATAAEQLEPARGQRIVQITFVKTERSRARDDPGNRMVRSKAVLDGLVHAGLLIDDTDEFLVLPAARETKAAAGPQTIIDIHETESGT